MKYKNSSSPALNRVWTNGSTNKLNIVMILSDDQAYGSQSKHLKL